mmetsp:Transcript_7195/g.11466  ORF Transcript_7195/g.11466 Transcript_7195/m.11466 type:complete len:120 (+) Transcript_7195:1815-2174(+)
MRFILIKAQKASNPTVLNIPKESQYLSDAKSTKLVASNRILQFKLQNDVFSVELNGICPYTRHHIQLVASITDSGWSTTSSDVRMLQGETGWTTENQSERTVLYGAESWNEGKRHELKV